MNRGHQAKLHSYNAVLLKVKSLHAWSDPGRTKVWVAAVSLLAAVLAIVPARYVGCFLLVLSHLFSLCLVVLNEGALMLGSRRLPHASCGQFSVFVLGAILFFYLLSCGSCFLVHQASDGVIPEAQAHV